MDLPFLTYATKVKIVHTNNEITLIYRFFSFLLVGCAEGIYIVKEKLKIINFNLFSMRVITIQKYKLNVKFRFKIFQLLRIS